MKIGQKLTLSFSIIFIIMAAIGGLLFWSLQKSEWQRERVGFAFLELAKVKKISRDINRQLKEVSDILLLGEEEEMEEYKEYKGKVLKSFDEWEKLIKEEVAFIAEEEEEEEEELETIATLRQLYNEILKGTDEIFRLEREGKHEGAVRKLEDVIEVKYDKEFEGLIEATIKDERGEVERTNRDAARLSNFIRTLSLASIGFALIFIVTVSIVITRAIAIPIIKLKNAAVEIGKGKLDTTIEVRSKDEIGDLATTFGQMTKDLKKLTQKEKEFAAAAAAAADKKKAADLEKTYKELKEKSESLERFHKVTVGREMEMVKLKEEVNALLEKLGQPKKYEAPEKIKGET